MEGSNHFIIKEERGMRIWKISADYTDYTDLKSFNDNIFFYLCNLRNLWINSYLWLRPKSVLGI